MTYRINTTDGNQLVDIPDGTLDTSATSLTLIGKNVTNFGEVYNENLVHLLENFSSSSAPEQALKGQLWYDSSTGRLNVYDGTNFRTAGGPIVSPSLPTTLIAGDLWINNATNQMYMFDGLDLILVGPSYTNAQGTSGIIVDSIIDTFNRTQVIVKLFVSNLLVGIFSKSAFIPAQPISGYSTNNLVRPVNIGFNVGATSTIKFDVTVTRSDSIVTDTGETKQAGQLVYNDEDASIVGSMTLQSDNGLIIGSTEDIQQKIVAGKFIIEHQNSSKDIGIVVKTPTGPAEAITVDATNARVGIFNTTPASTLDINGSVKISGDLVVGGESFTVNTTILQVEDKNIELGVTPQTPTDAAADGGGITLKGTTNKTFNWSDPYDSWTSSEHLDLVVGREYRIGTVPVLTETTLGPNVEFSSLTSLGSLSELYMANGLNIVGSNITNPIGNITLAPGPSATVSVSAKRITDLADPSALQDATTKTYVDQAVFRRGISMSMDITGLADNNQIAAILDKISPFYDPLIAPTGVAINGTLLRLHTTTMSVTNANLTYSPTENVEFTRITVTTPTGTDSAVTDISTGQTILAPAATVTVTRDSRLYTMTNGNWAYTGLIV